MAQKICPQCSQGMGPRSKSCPKCGYEYPHLQNGSSKKEAEYENDNIKPGKRNCSNCKFEYSSDDYRVDNYGTVTYHFKFDHYCSYSCVADSSSKKDLLLLQILTEIDNSTSDELKSFVERKEEESEISSLIADIFSREEALKEDEEYRKTHPEIVLTSNPRKRVAPTSIEECEDAGIKPPPKIGNYVPKEPEEEINPFKALLLGIKSPVIESEEEKDEEEEKELEVTPTPSKPLSIAELFAKSSPKPIVPTTPFKFVTPVIPVTPVVSNSISNSYDDVSKPTQGQRKCGAKDRAKGLMVGCGKINGVRVKKCICGYTFP